MLDGIAALITAVAGLITAIGGVVGMLIVARRTSPREREDAAHRATEQVLNPPSQLDAEGAAMTAIDAHRKRRSRRGR